MSLNVTKDDSFYVDLGATIHMANDLGILFDSKPYIGNDVIYVGKGDGLPISHIGDAIIPTNHGNIKLKGVLVIPELKKNLLSIRKILTDYPCIFEFTNFHFVIKDQQQ